MSRNNDYGTPAFFVNCFLAHAARNSERSSYGS